MEKIFPFILRNVKLLGIDSQNTPMDLRTQIWEKPAGDWKLSQLENVTKEITLNELEEHI